MVNVRRPCQAGAFYEGTPDALKKQIESCFIHKYGPGKIPKVASKRTGNIVGLICPHAGYMYSGPVMANAYYELALDGKPDVVVVLGPNHTGLGSALAIMNEGFWRTPLGDVEVDHETADAIIRESSVVDVDASAHRLEHSIEVQLPFLQYLYGSDFKLVPICFLMQDLTSAKEIGEAVGRIMSGKNGVVIASSDMTHYESQQDAERKDGKVLATVEAMDEAELYSIVESLNVTACGVGPIAATITASRVLGGKKAKLLCYKTSGDVVGDYSQVVGYAAVCFRK